MTPLPPGLRITLLLTDILMLVYWMVSATAVVGWIALPADFMYQGYGSPMMDAWNWSFAPLDVAFALSGLISVQRARRGDPNWVFWAMISLTLTFCAGLMAVSFWILTRDYNLSWWIPNLALIAVALYWLPRLDRGHA
jgi:hypothetical protein